MRRFLMMMMLVTLGAAPLAGADDETGPTRPSKCPALGRGIIWVQHRWFRRSGPPNDTGDINGSGGPWLSPPLPPFTLGEPAVAPPNQPSAAPLDVPGVSLIWSLGATGDFDGDGTCDLVWVERNPAPRGGLRGVALAITGASPDGRPSFGGPDTHAIFAGLEPDETLVGSGDFVGWSGEPGLAPPDGRPDLLFWNSTLQELRIWASNGAGGFPVGGRYNVAVAQVGWEPVAVANLDGRDAAEVVWREVGAHRLAFTSILAGETGLLSGAGGPLIPEQPADSNWTLRATDDFNGDGRDDLVFQNETSEKSVVWYMDGPSRHEGWFFAPDRLAGPETLDVDQWSETWTIIGPR